MYHLKSFKIDWASQAKPWPFLVFEQVNKKLSLLLMAGADSDRYISSLLVSPDTAAWTRIRLGLHAEIPSALPHRYQLISADPRLVHTPLLAESFWVLHCRPDMWIWERGGEEGRGSRLSGLFCFLDWNDINWFVQLSAAHSWFSKYTDTQFTHTEPHWACVYTSVPRS